MPVRISIITPSFNQAAYLESTLRSVIAQRDRVHEFFVIDGGSDDGSVAIIKEYARFIDHWVSEPDEGQSDALRRGFDRATGDVLYWLNSDDILLPGALSRVHQAFEQRPELDVVTGWGVAIDEDGRIVRMRRRPHDSPWWAHLGYVRVVQPCCFFRRRLYESIGGLDRELHCVLDTELWYRMFRQRTPWGGIDAYLAAYRLHPEAKGSTMGAEYRAERALMKRTYPELTARPLRHAVGRLAYYGAQLASGRGFRAARETRRHRGRPLGEVFGEIAPEVDQGDPVGTCIT